MHDPRSGGAQTRLLRLDDLSLQDLEAMRLLLRGASIIDWHRLDFRDHADVDRFLRVNEFEPESTADMERLEELRLDAVDYVLANFDINLHQDVLSDVPARDLFLIASRTASSQTNACVVLKIMHILRHLEGRALSTRLAISDDQIFSAVERKVLVVVDELRAAGYPITEFEWSRKSRDSLITKLLAKRSTLAANIYDKLRFRLIVKEHSDLPLVLAALTRRLIPFNYVVPGESVNHLLSFRDLLSSDEHLGVLAPQLQPDQSLERTLDQRAAEPLNEFSSSNYRILNFVADLPIRVDHLTPPNEMANVVFVMTEFQLADSRTVAENEVGEGNHRAYKQRQYRSVRVRLLRGRQKSADHS